MAAEEADHGDGTTEADADWLSSQSLKDQQESEVATLPDSGAKVKFRIMPPEKFASLVAEYDIADMAEDLGEIDADADLQDPQAADLDDVGADDISDLKEELRVMLFFRDVILPQIDRPEKVHWCNPDHMADPEWVDMSELSSEDKMFLVAKITGQDPDQVADAAEDRIERFQG